MYKLKYFRNKYLKYKNKYINKKKNNLSKVVNAVDTNNDNIKFNLKLLKISEISNTTKSS